jgi:hypothetical protein
VSIIVTHVLTAPMQRMTRDVTHADGGLVPEEVHEVGHERGADASRDADLVELPVERTCGARGAGVGEGRQEESVPLAAMSHARYFTPPTSVFLGVELRQVPGEWADKRAASSSMTTQPQRQVHDIR